MAEERGRGLDQKRESSLVAFLMNLMVSGHAQKHGKKGKEERKRGRSLPQAPMTSSEKVFGGYGEGICGFNERNQGERRERKIRLRHGLLKRGRR